MKMTQLLTGAAAIALVAGAAQAQTVTPAAGAGQLSGQTVMSERTGALSGNVVLGFGLDGVFATMGAGGVVQVDVQLTNATFSSIVPNTAWAAATNANCDFGTPSLGGGAGGDSVRFESQAQINLCATATGGDPDDGVLTLPVNVTNNGQDVVVTVTFTPTADAGGYGGTSVDNTVLDFAQAYTFSFTPGAVGSGQFDSTGDALIGSGVIGTFDLAASPALIREDVDNVLADVQTAATGATMLVTFPSGATGIGGVSYTPGAGPVVNCAQGAAPNDNEFSCAVTGLALDALFGGGTDPITITDDGDPLTTITTQVPTAEISFTDAANYDVSNVAASNLQELDLDDGLATETFNDGSFPWVSVRTDGGGTASAFRVTGLASDLSGTGEEIQVRAVRSNGTIGTTDWVGLTPASVDASVDGTTWTATFQSDEIGTALGVSGNVNADLEFRVRCGDTPCNDGLNANLEVLRVLSRSGIVTGTGFDG